MERLTKKLRDGNFTCECGLNYFEYGDGHLEIFNKLGHLEDLEQELGIPLEVLFKAFKSKIKLNKYNFLFVIEHLIKIEDEFCFVVVDERNAFIVETIKIKDYGKTWWLED